MAQMYFKTLSEAKSVAKRRDKKVYKIKEGVYYVGTYEGAMKALQRRAYDK